MPAWIGCMYVPAHVTSDGGRTTPRRRDCVMPGAAGHCSVVTLRGVCTR